MGLQKANIGYRCTGGGEAMKKRKTLGRIAYESACRACDVKAHPYTDQVWNKIARAVELAVIRRAVKEMER